MFDLPTLLPPNAQKVEYDLEQLSAHLQGMAAPVQSLWDAEICPEHLLPYLAWAFSVEVWEASWPEAYRRQVLVDAVQVHRRKGTVGAVRRSVTARGFDVELFEWFETGDAPHTFRLDAYSPAPLDEFAGSQSLGVAQLRSIVAFAKPERSHLTGLRIGYRSATTASFGQASSAAVRIAGIGSPIRTPTRVSRKVALVTPICAGLRFLGAVNVLRTHKMFAQVTSITAGGVAAVRMTGTARAQRYSQ